MLQGMVAPQQPEPHYFVNVGKSGRFILLYLSTKVRQKLLGPGLWSAEKLHFFQPPLQTGEARG